jgi:hypothetical protein
LDCPKINLVLNAMICEIRDKKIVDLIRAALLTPVVTTKPMDEALKKKRENTRRNVFWLKMSQNLILSGSKPSLVLHLRSKKAT